MGKLAIGRLTPGSVWRKIKEEAWFKMESPMEAPSTARAAYDLLGPGMWGRKVERGPGWAEMDCACCLQAGERSHSWRRRQQTINYYRLEIYFYFWQGFMCFWCCGIRYHNLRTTGPGNLLPSTSGIWGFETLPRTLEVKTSSGLPIHLTDN